MSIIGWNKLFTALFVLSDNNTSAQDRSTHVTSILSNPVMPSG